jgi:tRNA(Ile)-lysidine synthase
MNKHGDLLPRFPAAFDDLDRDAPALVAVSGGIDSVVLLDLLRRAGFRRLIVAHFHHGLRGPAAEADADFVRKLAKKLRLPFVPGRGRTRAAAAKKKQSLEEAARNLRRAFLAKTARKHNAATIFLGHHAGDVAETLLFHLARGGGTRGLSSLRPRAPLDRTGLQLARPMLGFTRAEIAAHAAIRRLAHREDETNATREHTRNRLRHDILPALAAAVGHDPVPALARAAAILAAEDEWMESLLAPQAQAAELSLPLLASLPVAAQRRLLRTWLRGQTHGEPDFDTLERARLLALSRTSPAKLNLPRHHHLRRRAGKLFVEKSPLA